MLVFSRPAVLRMLGALSVAKPPSPPGSTPESTVLPLALCGGAYCVEYSVDGQRFRAVADTGSPFLLVDGTCGGPGYRGESPWGCYRGDGLSAGLEDTTERFGG